MGSKVISAILAIGLGAVSAEAQTSLITASPIPDGATEELCYYDGMAYSPNAYVFVTGRQARLSTGSSTETDGALHSGRNVVVTGEEHLLECVAGADGKMRWSPKATIQSGN